ncbi:hypothetical protein RB653_005106 [Dictyostelium firmibasis]|uniref:Uncharacterized protein n=1 Tax=Dictyostelium firmibasis TaxID=79012 RepID=A0AAN7U8U9_9MYCE
MYINKKINDSKIDNKKVVALLFIAFVIANGSQIINQKDFQKQLNIQTRVEKKYSRSDIKNLKKQLFFNNRVQCNKKNNI